MRLILLGLFVAVVVNGQHNLNQLPSKSVIAQLFEWKFSDIAFECEQWLGPKGYGAVQVSPVNEHIVFEGRPWWERYQPISYKIQTRSGDEEAFLNMTRRCNASGVRVYVDVVLNHMAGENPPPVIGTAGSTADPVKFAYPAVPYTRKNFHKSCAITDWNNAEHLRHCEVSGLRDLNHTQPYVRDKIIAYLNRLVDLGAAGFRVDAARHMWPADLAYIFSSVNFLNTDFGFAERSRPFILNEIVDFGSDRGEVGRWEYAHLGRITDFMVPGEIGRAFRGYNNLKHLRNWGPQWTFLPSRLAVVFLVDHEIQRGQGLGGADVLSYREYKEYKMGTAWMLAHSHGTPRILSSYHYADINQGPPSDGSGAIQSPGLTLTAHNCQHGWICEHRWHPIAHMVELRNVADGVPMSNWWDNGLKHIAFSRQDRAFVAFNGHKKRNFDWALQTCLPAGTYCDIISGKAEMGKCTGTAVRVDEHGLGRVFIDQDSVHGVLAIHVGPSSALGQSCVKQSLKQILTIYWSTDCYKDSKYLLIK